MAFLARHFYTKLFPPSLPPADTFAGHTIVITGGTGGLGFETAVLYLRLSAARVIITARNVSKGSAAVAKIKGRCPNASGVIEYRELDMSTFAGVKKFIDTLEADDTVKDIDTVLLNAGLQNIKYEKTPDGWEETLQVNVLSTALLGLLLVPLMRARKPKNEKRATSQHLGFVSSRLHTFVNISKPDFPKEDILGYYKKEEHFVPYTGSYGVSKLLMMYAAAEIAKLAIMSDGTWVSLFIFLPYPNWYIATHLPRIISKVVVDLITLSYSPSPIVNTMCPGICASDLARKFSEKGFFAWLAVGVFKLLAKSTETGARTFVLAALTGPEEHGKCISHYGTDEQYAQ
jgi:NAD(P)-dependent dehydrogenase (short-subunit alcohol dehydrogenase family)